MYHRPEEWLKVLSMFLENEFGFGDNSTHAILCETIAATWTGSVRLIIVCTAYYEWRGWLVRSCMLSIPIWHLPGVDVAAWPFGQWFADVISWLHAEVFATPQQLWLFARLLWRKRAYVRRLLYWSMTVRYDRCKRCRTLFL